MAFGSGRSPEPSESICGRAAVIKNGRAVIPAEIDAIRTSLRQRKVQVECKAEEITIKRMTGA